MSLHCVEHRQEPLEKLHVQMFPAKAKAVHKPTQDSSVPVGFDDAELIERASKAKGGHGPKFARLFAGDWTGAGFSSQSEADMSLCGSLYFWTGGDLTRTDQLFRASGLMRDKWDKKHFSNGNTYGQATLENCVGGKVYTPKGSKASSAKGDSTEAVQAEFSETWDRYAISDGKVCEVKEVKDAKGNTVEIAVPLCNFDARIVAETTRNDGAAKVKLYTIAGKLANGPTLATLDIPANNYAGMTWTSEWGARAAIIPKQGAREHLRYAVQIRPNPEGLTIRTVYACLGWMETPEHGTVYVHANGAIGTDGSVALEVEHKEHLTRYALPDPPEGEALVKAVRASVSVLDVANPFLTVVLYLYLFRVLLGEVRFTAFLYGTTGTLKSSLTGLLMQHFGVAFNYDALGMAWEASVTSLEQYLSKARDAIAVIDDFNPTGSLRDVQGLHAKAERVLRAQGNGKARDRSSWQKGGFLDTATPYDPKGGCISTGEDIPNGQSLRARNLILEVRNGDVVLANVLKKSKVGKAGLYAQAMAGFIRWLAGDLKTKQATFKARALELVEELAIDGHARTTTAAAELIATSEVLASFAEEVGALDSAQKSAFLKLTRRAVLIACADQKAHQEAADPVRVFIELLPALVVSGTANLEGHNGGAPLNPETLGWEYAPNNDGGTWKAKGKRIGWLADNGDWFLEPNTVFAEAQAFASRQGTNLGKSARAIWKAMSERGLIVVHQGQNTVVKVVAGERRRVLHLRRSAIELSEDVTQDENLGVGGVCKNSDFSDGANNTVLDVQKAVTVFCASLFQNSDLNTPTVERATNVKRDETTDIAKSLFANSDRDKTVTEETLSDTADNAQSLKSLKKNTTPTPQVFVEKSEMLEAEL
jgi:hypothetical protein